MHHIHLSARRVLAISFCSMLFGIMLAMLGGFFYFQYLFTDAPHTNISAAPLSPPAVPAPTVCETLSGNADAAPIHLLLIGQDRREGEQTARSDTIILCTIDVQAETMTLTSFLRDLYVQIPGYGSNRLNASYAFGGAPLLCRTLEQNFDIPIDGSLEVDFSGFSEIIDLLGGVELSLRQDEADYIGGQLDAGLQLLSGEQALAYVRIRRLDSDGDFSRTERQRKLLTALLDSCRNVSLPTLVKLARKVFPLLSTDLSGETLLNLARRTFPVLSSAKIISQHIPTPGSYTEERINGMSVLVPDLDAARAHLRDTIHSGET